MKKAIGYVSLGVLLAAPALAEERGPIGLNFSVGGGSRSIGATWHATDRLALRPTFEYDHLRSDGSATYADGRAEPTERRFTSVGGGVAALLYLSRRDTLSAYVAGAVALTRDSQHYGTPLERTTRNGHTLSARFGVQYAVTKKVSAFAETGLSYTRSKEGQDWAGREDPWNLSAVRHEDTVKRIGTLSTSVGAIFYLR
jgi:hypothetical protein